MAIRALLIAAAVVADLAWLNIYAFGEDDYTNDGRSRWETHGSWGSHLFYAVAVAVWLLLLAAAAFLRRRQVLLSVVGVLTVVATLAQWMASHFAFDNN